MSQGPVLFYCPQMRRLAEDVYFAASRQSPIAVGKISWNLFPDGSLDAIIGAGESGYVRDMIRERDIVFLASFDSLAEIQKQLLIIYQLARFEAHSLKIVIPYFPGTMDREDREGRVVSAAGYMDQLAGIPLQRGPAIVITFDLHVPHELFYLGHHARCRAVSAIPLLRQRLAGLGKDERFVKVAFPDDGAYKRFAHMLPGSPIICYKKRNGEKRTVTVVDGDPEGRHVTIVDDLIMTGSTMLECKDALFARGAKAVSLFATHGVFPQESWKKFLAADFTNVWTTDSCPQSAQGAKTQKPFEILSLAPLIAHEIMTRNH